MKKVIISLFLGCMMFGSLEMVAEQTTIEKVAPMISRENLSGAMTLLGLVEVGLLAKLGQMTWYPYTYINLRVPSGEFGQEITASAVHAAVVKHKLWVDAGKFITQDDADHLFKNGFKLCTKDEADSVGFVAWRCVKIESSRMQEYEIQLVVENGSPFLQNILGTLAVAGLAGLGGLACLWYNTVS